MDKLLFNINDMVLILVITVCLMHVFTINFQYRAHKSQIYLTLFLISVAITSFDQLIYWSPAIKYELMYFSPHIFFILKFSIFAQPPLLYFYTKSVIHSDFNFKRKDFLHFSPAALYLLCIPLLYLLMGPEKIAQGVHNYSVLYQNILFKSFMWGSKISFIAYGVIALWMLVLHKKKLKDITSNIQGINAEWLKLLVIGFLFVWLLGTFAQLQTQINIPADLPALTQNYMRFFLINILVFLSISRSHNIRQHDTSEKNAPNAVHSYTEEQVRRLHDAMEVRKVYLDPDLSLEQLSEITSLPQRLLSLIINRHFGKNFFEFVNYYRVEHAKQLLSDSSKKFPMIEIMSESGFNSKSAFNRFFKKFTDMTPSQYKASLC